MRGLFSSKSDGGIEVRFLKVGEGSVLKSMRAASYVANPIEMGPEGAHAEVDAKSDIEWDNLACSRFSKSLVVFDKGEPIACLTLRKDPDKKRIIDGEEHNLCYAEHLFIVPGKRSAVSVLLPMLSTAREYIQNDSNSTLVMVAVMAKNIPMLAMIKGFGFKYDKEGEHDREYSDRDAMEFYSLRVKAKPDALGQEIMAIMDETPVPVTAPITDADGGKNRMVITPPKAKIPGVVWQPPGRRR
ncbi:MAG: hypothetical protein EBQ96_09015 [Proteobacteria bacterium]|nr:hypothetical protein [Pseudomonadota bacterium]